jgi:RNA polymerase primary sigma factor
MPALSRVRSPALEQLAQQFRFASPAAVRRQIERIESLAAELDPARNYPEDWLVFRITGYRPTIEEPATFVGEALLGDLSALAERLSDAGKLRTDEFAPGSVLSIDDVMRRWRVSRKTIDRMRRRGLIARRVRDEGRARSRLLFSIEHVEAYERAHKDTLEGASRFSRIGEPDRKAILARAREMHERHAWTLNRVARALASEHGRAHETLRQMLRNHDARSREAIFGERGPASDRDRRFIERAAFAGFWPEEIAERLDRPARSVRRIIVDAHAARLRSLRLIPGSEAEFDARVLESDLVCRDLGSPGVSDLLEFVHAARRTPPPIGAVERARTLALRALMDRAARAIALLPDHGASGSAVEAIERDLRWASRLKAELIRAQLGVLLRALESSVGRSAEEVRATPLSELMRSAIRAAGDAVDGFDPSRGGRLAGAVGLGVTRVATAWAREGSNRTDRNARKAGATLTPGFEIEDWTLGVSPWQRWKSGAWLEAPPHARESLPSLAERERLLLELRFGWGPRPHSIAEIARVIEQPVMRASILLRRALRVAAHGARKSRDS